MQSNDFAKSSVAATILIIVFLFIWEYYWRTEGYTISYNDDKVIWADRRKKVYESIDKATVFIGSSRIKFDLDIPTWNSLTGEEAIQLALVGTSPRQVLNNLANDVHFKGKIIMDVQEHAFFNVDSFRANRSARDGIEYYEKETPAQKANTSIDFMLESNFVFLEEGKFGLNAILSELPVKDRPGVRLRTFPPKYFSTFSRNRQALMTPMFLADKNYQNNITQCWVRSAMQNKSVPIRGDTLASYFKELKSSIDKIRSRGGKLVLVRPPSSGTYLKRENRDYPKDIYWDQLLIHTQTDGIYYRDYPETDHFICLEESHLTPTDAITYTTALVHILKEKGWTFQGPHDPKKNQ